MPMASSRRAAGVAHGGGGIFNDGILRMENCQIVGNFAAFNGGAGAGADGGGILNSNGGTLTFSLGTVDNNYAAQSSQPPLTTVEQPTIEVGREMADVLLRLIDGQRVHTVSMMPTAIIDRDSA